MPYLGWLYTWVCQSSSYEAEILKAAQCSTLQRFAYNLEHRYRIQEMVGCAVE